MINTFHGKERYLYTQIFLLGSKEGERIKIPLGDHTYNFSFPLPLEIPFSVEGKHRHIRYKVEAILDSHPMDDLCARRPFMIARCDETKFCPELRVEVEVEEIRRFCYLLCKSSPLIITVRLPKTVYTLGEKIPINVEIINKSFTNVIYTVIMLNRIDILNSQSPIVSTKTMKKLIAELRCNGVRRGESLTLQELIKVPADALITIDQHCNVFQTSYELRLTAETEGIRSTPFIQIPITVGSANPQIIAPPNYDELFVINEE